MGIIKRFWYFVIKEKHRPCDMCSTSGIVFVGVFKANMKIEHRYYLDSQGHVQIKCPACDGNGLILRDD